MKFLDQRKIHWYWIGGFFLAIILFFTLLNFGVFGEMPSIKELENPKSHMASEVYASDGTMIGKIYTHNRVPCNFKELPPHLVNALIATEDSRFYIHSGIDPKAIMGVVKGMFTTGNRGGGSTITQQLAKNLFPRGRVNGIQLVFRKFKEWLIAVKLERNFTKHEIISSYFNTVEFSDNAFGIKAAAKTYFNKKIQDITVDEAAILVGMLKATYTFNPRVHPEASRERRNVVLGKMLEYKFLTKEEHDKYVAKPIKLDFNNDFYTDDLSPYFISYLKKYLKNYFTQHPKKDGSVYDIYSDGLKIYTTIDLKMQTYAEEAVQEHLKYYQKLLTNHWAGSSPWYSRPSFFLRHVKKSQRYKDLKATGMEDDSIYAELKKPIKMTIWTYDEPKKEVTMSPWDSIKYYNMILQVGFLAVEPQTGHVKAWVGGANFDHFKYDHVNPNTKRQVGSIFKPFLYAAAVDQKGYSPCHRVPNARIVFRPGNPKWKLAAAWSPSNSGGGYGGAPTLTQALSKSLNTVSARLMYEVGPYEVIKLCRNLGIDSNTKLKPYPSICLGTPEISVFEMVGAYTAYANEGLYNKPIFIKNIDDMNGNTIYESYPTLKEAFRPEVAFVMQEMMKGVVDQGTAKRLKGTYGLKGEICGKTGTTQSNADGWFIGLTPKLIAGVWVGCDDRLVRFRSTGLGQGASMALPIWGKFFGKLAKDKDTTYNKIQDAKFAKLDTSKRTIITDCSKYHGWGAGVEKGTDLTKILETEAPSDLMENKYDNLEEEDMEKGLEEESEPSTPSPNKKVEPTPANVEDKKKTVIKHEGK
jgi:penicillin-binding protein 1A